jgi:hypothetical protein
MSEPIDAAVLYRQIPLYVRFQLGITRSKIVRSDTEVRLPIRDSYRRKVIVTLCGDNYDLVYGKVQGVDWVEIASMEGVGCEQLGEALVGLVERAAGRRAHPPADKVGADWTDMGAELFDGEARPVQGGLFPEADPLGTGELF